MFLPSFLGNRKQFLVVLVVFAVLVVAIGLVLGMPFSLNKNSLEKANEILDKHPLIDG